MTVLLAYLRDGHVYADHEAWEHGQDHAPYEIVCDDPPYARTKIAGVEYVSEWFWTFEAKRQFGAVKLIPRSEMPGR